MYIHSLPLPTLQVAPPITLLSILYYPDPILKARKDNPEKESLFHQAKERSESKRVNGGHFGKQKSIFKI